MKQPQHNPDSFDRLGAALARLGAVLVAIGLVGLALDGCHPRLPPQTNCSSGEQRCVSDRPYVCSATHRLEPAGDRTCASVGGVCVVTGGVAHCALASDGGAP